MSDQPSFRTPEAEVLRLLDELSALRDILREVSSKLSRLDMRTKRAFPIAAQVHLEKAKARKDASGTPTLTTENVLKHYDRVVEAARSGSYRHAADLLDQMSLPDLVLMHREVGLSIGKASPSKKALLNAVLGRVKESVLLTRHSPRPVDTIVPDHDAPSSTRDGATDHNLNEGSEVHRLPPDTDSHQKDTTDHSGKVGDQDSGEQGDSRSGENTA